MAKITIDTKGLITSEEDVQKAFQVATRVYHLLKEKVGFDVFDMIEIIKATTWTEDLGGEPVHFMEFQIVYTISFSSTEKEKSKIVAEWDSRDKYNVVVRKDEPLTGGYIGCISLAGLGGPEIEALAKALIMAIRLGIQDRQARLEKLIKRLKETEAYMESLIMTSAEV